MTAMSTTLRRELMLAWRAPGQGLSMVAFFIMAASLFPLGIGPEVALLRRIAPGILWVSALLAALMGLSRMFEGDFLDGTLEQMSMRESFGLMVAGKIIAHWLTTGLPLVVMSPVLALQFGLDSDSLALLTLSLIPGTLLMSLIGAVGAALILGLRSSGVLLTVLVLPLYVPVLIFGSGMVETAQSGLDPMPYLSILAAMLALALFFAPLVTVTALRIALE